MAAGTKKKPSRLARTLLETAGDMRKAAHEKITARHLGPAAAPKLVPMTGARIRKLRESANMSQAVFARHLNVTVGYVSQLERGAKQPSGAALALLNVIHRKGIAAIL
jgi:putative transcriptional regulator